jgi:N-acetyl-anhydromuramyl-L-alanine amidase AmpD
MSDSPLVNYTRISPNSANPRRDKIRKITIHHMAGNLSVETCGEAFANPKRQASANYGIGSDGRVGLYVREENRAWTSGSPENDHQAVTIEVANDGGAPDWHVSDLALIKLVDLCVDICQRNGIAALNFTGDASGNLTMHRYFAATECPGPYLARYFPWIEIQVNQRLKEEAGVRYKTIADVPSWGQETITKLTTKGLLAGKGEGDLDLSEDMVRMLVILDRAKVFGE